MTMSPRAGSRPRRSSWNERRVRPGQFTVAGTGSRPRPATTSRSRRATRPART
jgi:hypothetical protein